MSRFSIIAMDALNIALVFTKLGYDRGESKDVVVNGVAHESFYLGWTGFRLSRSLLIYATEIAKWLRSARIGRGEPSNLPDDSTVSERTDLTRARRPAYLYQSSLATVGTSSACSTRHPMSTGRQCEWSPSTRHCTDRGESERQ